MEIRNRKNDRICVSPSDDILHLQSGMILPDIGYNDLEYLYLVFKVIKCSWYFSVWILIIFSHLGGLCGFFQRRYYEIWEIVEHSRINWKSEEVKRSGWIDAEIARYWSQKTVWREIQITFLFKNRSVFSIARLNQKNGSNSSTFVFVPHLPFCLILNYRQCLQQHFSRTWKLL